jgi:hypothetical protein
LEDGLCAGIPADYRFDLVFANGVRIRVANDGSTAPGIKWFGERGRWVHVDRGLSKTNPPDLFREPLGPDAVRLHQSDNHAGDFLAAIVDRSRQTVAPAEAGHRAVSAGMLGEIAIHTGRKIRWNPVTEEILGDEEASRMLGRPYREPWSL